MQAKVSLRGAWFAAHPNQPMPEGRAEVERLFAAIEAEARASLDVERLARALHRSSVRRIEWSDLNEADRGMWRRHAATVAREYEAQP